MTVVLDDYASGETGYIAKLNSNNARIVAALNALQTIVAAGSGAAAISPAAFFGALFENTASLIGNVSYKPVGSGTNLTVAAGGAYRPTTQTVVQSLAPVVLNFAGQTAATYYIVPDTIGNPTFTTSPVNAVYSVVWTGTSFGTITKIAKALFTASEEGNARISTPLGTFSSLDARLESTEATVAALGGVLTIVNRKVGLSLDGGGVVITTGVKGAIQVDFNGTIIGWMAIADQVGTISVEVDLKRTSPPSAPPTAPPIPNTTSDKISASAPITINASPPSQSQSVAAAGVSTWSTGIQKWDVIQFNVTAVSLIQRVTLYILILPS